MDLPFFILIFDVFWREHWPTNIFLFGVSDLKKIMLALFFPFGRY